MNLTEPPVVDEHHRPGDPNRRPWPWWPSPLNERLAREQQQESVKHQAQEVGIFQALNMQVLHASGEGILAARASAEIRDQGFATKDLVVMAPDAGAEKRARVFARSLARNLGVSEIPVVTASKERNVNEISLRFNSDVKGKVAIAIDDETASGGTLNELGKAATGMGARRVYAAVSHLTAGHDKHEETAR